MRAKRLRGVYAAGDLNRIYEATYDHTRWWEHVLRVNVTIAMARTLADFHRDRVGADLSCGDGSILQGLKLVERYFGDFAPGYQFRGPIEETIRQIPYVDLFVCTETIEHLNYPDDVVAAIGQKANRLVLSTPVGAWEDNNPEHYWAWDREYVEHMIQQAGFSNIGMYAELDCVQDGRGYIFGIWGCSK